MVWVHLTCCVRIYEIWLDLMVPVSWFAHHHNISILWFLTRVCARSKRLFLFCFLWQSCLKNLDFYPGRKKNILQNPSVNKAYLNIYLDNNKNTFCKVMYLRKCEQWRILRFFFFLIPNPIFFASDSNILRTLNVQLPMTSVAASKHSSSENQALGTWWIEVHNYAIRLYHI